MTEDQFKAMRKRDRIRERSGAVTSKSKLVSFLYTLLRDYVTPGIIEKLVSKLEDHNGRDVIEYTFSNGWLANYAKDIAERLNKTLKELKE